MPKLTLRDLFAVVTIVAFIFAAFLAGVRLGYRAGYRQASVEYGVDAYPRHVYNVSDLVIPRE